MDPSTASPGRVGASAAVTEEWFTPAHSVWVCVGESTRAPHPLETLAGTVLAAIVEAVEVPNPNSTFLSSKDTQSVLVTGVRGCMATP